MKSSSKRSPSLVFLSEFLAGGLGALSAITLIHPIDVVKSRSQLSGELSSTHRPAHSPSILKWLGSIAREEGIRGLYRGLPAAYCLQFSVTATRFATYGLAKSLIPERTFRQDLLLAVLSGALGGVAGNPWFAIKTRAQVYSSSPRLQVGATTPQAPPGPVFREFALIYAREGLKGYFRGLDAFLPRVMVYGGAQLASYDWCKSRLGLWTNAPMQLSQPNSHSQVLVASVCAACASVCAIQPFDFLAARLQNQAVDSAGRGLLYSGPLDCLRKSVRSEGPFVVLKGFRANIFRFGPYTVFTFFFVEKFRALMNQL